MPERIVSLGSTSQVAVLLDAARGILEGELERRLRARARRRPFGRIGRIERLDGDWLTTDLVEHFSRGVPDAFRRGIRAKYTHPKAVPDRHWLGFAAKWYVVDLLHQPILDDDNCEVSVRGFVAWSVQRGKLVFRTAPVRLKDVEIRTGVSLTGALLTIARFFVNALGLAGLAVIDSKQIMSLPTQLTTLVERHRDRLVRELGDEEVGLVDLWIEGRKPVFRARFVW
jgi:hypothetical protein